MGTSHQNADQLHVFQRLSQIISGAALLFQRKRCWGPLQALVTVFVMRCPALSLTARTAIPETRTLFGTLFGWESTPDASGLSRARRRLRMPDVVAMWKRCQAWAMEHAAEQAGQWIPGRVIAAIDGTILHMPRSASTVKAYPIAKDKIGMELHHYPQARLVSAWDVERRIPLAWCTTATKVGERKSLLKLLCQLPSNSVLLLDRGFPSREVVGKIIAAGHDAVMRMVSTEAASWPEVAAFLAAGERQAVVPVRVRCGRSLTMVPMRLVLRVFERGRPHQGEGRETMVVMTTITDPAVVADDQVVALYGDRWGIETIHREMKSLADLERWHGTTKLLLEQEIHAVMSWFAIAGAMASRLEAEAAAADRKVPPDQDGNLPEPKRVHTPTLFIAVHHALIWQAAIGHLDDAVVDYLRRQALIYLDSARAAMARRRPGRWHARKPKHPYARRVT
jgi:hypothetical protein